MDKLKQDYIEQWSYSPLIKPVNIKYTACGEAPKEPPIYTPCWIHPIIPKSIKFDPCWDYQDSKLKNKPKCKPEKVKEIENIIPNFDHVKTLYTKWDFKLEQCVQEQVLRLEAQFTQIEQQLRKESDKQITYLESMRYHSTRYRLLVQSGVEIKPYPEYLSNIAERRALCYFQKEQIKLNESNANLAESIVNIQDTIKELNRRVDQLDRKLQSPFLMGNGYGEPSLEVVLGMLECVYKYFYGIISKLKIWAELIDVGDECSIEDYIALLHNTNDFKTFMSAGLINCTCKRTDNKRLFDVCRTCWCNPNSHNEKLKFSYMQQYHCKVEAMHTSSTATQHSSTIKYEKEHNNCSHTGL